MHGFRNLICDDDILLIANLVFQAGPPIHRNRAELHLHLHRFFLIVQVDRRFHDQVQTAIAVWLGILNIVLPLDQHNVILAEKGVCQHIDIRLIGTNDPHASDVIDVLFDALDAQGKLLAR